MAVSRVPTARAPLSRRWMTAGVAVIILALLAALAFSITQRGSGATTATLPTTTVGRGALVATVAGSGTIAAEQSLDLPFRVAGSVTEVLVAEGDVVQAGQPLARIDTRDLELQVASAEASLQSAQARLAQLTGGNATPEQLAASQASVASAEANLARTRTGNVTAADIAEAEAQVRSAQATLDDLLAGPKADTLASAQASYDQAVADLASQRASLSAAKTSAESALLQAADSLRDAQDEYSRIYWDNRDLERLPGDLPQERIDQEAAALRAVATAAETLRQRQVALDEAKEAERTGLAKAEAQLRNAGEPRPAAHRPAAQRERRGPGRAGDAGQSEHRRPARKETRYDNDHRSGRAGRRRRAAPRACRSADPRTPGRRGQLDRRGRRGSTPGLRQPARQQGARLPDHARRDHRRGLSGRPALDRQRRQRRDHRLGGGDRHQCAHGDARLAGQPWPGQ